jgi:endonuclease/exonuclease/phosphatase family metal-dependent hydrolase
MKAKSGLSIIDKILLWVNCFIWVSLLFSYLAPSVDPRKAWAIAFFGLAYPLLLTCNVVLFVYWLFRKKRYALVSALIVASGWSVLKNNIGFHSSGGNADKSSTDTNVIRLMTYNVHDFKRYGSKNDTSTRHDILNIISGQKPDIIGFQEFYSRKTGAYDMVDSIIRLMGADNYYFQPLIFNRAEAIGIAIFSKYPVINHGMINISTKGSENGCLYVDVKKGGQVFRVYAVHLQSIHFDPEDYKYLKRIEGPEGTEKSSARRLGSKLKTAFIKRSAQVDMIKADAAKCTTPYIIAGDFNDTPSSYSVNEMSKGLKNAFREKGFGFGRTYNGDFPNYQIDYILASPQFDVASYQIIEKKLSDHYPVRSDLVIGH